PRDAAARDPRELLARPPTFDARRGRFRAAARGGLRGAEVVAAPWTDGEVESACSALDIRTPHARRGRRVDPRLVQLLGDGCGLARVSSRCARRFSREHGCAGLAGVVEIAHERRDESLLAGELPVRDHPRAPPGVERALAPRSPRPLVEPGSTPGVVSSLAVPVRVVVRRAGERCRPRRGSDRRALATTGCAGKRRLQGSTWSLGARAAEWTAQDRRPRDAGMRYRD